MSKEAKEEFGIDRKASVSARAYAAAMLAVSTEETRFYLNGVFIEPCPAGGAMLVATNGHILIAVHDKDGEANGSWICPVPPQMRQFLLANCEPRPDPDDEDGFYLNDDEPDVSGTPERRQIDRISFDGVTASITSPEYAYKEKSPLEVVMAATAKAIDGKFPEWSRVIPRPNDKTSPLPGFSMSGQYGMEICRAVRIWKNDLYAGTRVRTVEKNGPLLMAPYGNTDLLIVLMPMKDDSDPLTVPEWVPEPAKVEPV